mmetsp:Transcript_16169/g.63046  ORF Transcript_16169/g.63046 Transcript_16169/m.63046 type:complete len:581 (-) Transcript_16169:57-1799(-)
MELAVPEKRQRSASIGGADGAAAQSEPDLITPETRRRHARLDEMGVEDPSASMPSLQAKEVKKRKRERKGKKTSKSQGVEDSVEADPVASDEEEEAAIVHEEDEDSDEEAYFTSAGHVFHKSTFNSPTYCTACCSFIWGIRKQGSSCQVCCAPVHDRCRDNLKMACYEARYVEVSGKEVVTFEHHWLPGNLQLATSNRCIVCSKGCKNSMSKSFHCARCKRAVHAKCKDDAVVCTPRLRQLLFCSTLMSRDFADYTPLLVYVNTKSGGQQGFQVLRRMRRFLTHVQVVDMFGETPVGPSTTLLRYAAVPNLRILVCGGDGTAGWVLGEMDKIEAFRQANPPLAVLPLGTGNDLARVLGWGGGYEGEHVGPILERIERASSVKLDRWKVKITQHASGKVEEFVFNNYFSIGIDAKIALKFHNLRQSTPDLFKSRLVNKGVYGGFGIQNAVSKAETMKDLNVQVVVDQEPAEFDTGLEGIVFLNIQSYAGGTDLWGKVSESDEKRRPGRMDDGSLEVVGLRGVTHMLGMQAGLVGGERITQGSEIVLTGAAMDVQVDGEPMHVEECTITVTYFNSVDMLLAP